MSTETEHLDQANMMPTPRHYELAKMIVERAQEIAKSKSFTELFDSFETDAKAKEFQKYVKALLDNEWPFLPTSFDFSNTRNTPEANILRASTQIAHYLRDLPKEMVDTRLSVPRYIHDMFHSKREAVFWSEDSSAYFTYIHVFMSGYHLCHTAPPFDWTEYVANMLRCLAEIHLCVTEKRKQKKKADLKKKGDEYYSLCDDDEKELVKQLVCDAEKLKKDPTNADVRASMVGILEQMFPGDTSALKGGIMGRLCGMKFFMKSPAVSEEASKTAAEYILDSFSE